MKKICSIIGLCCLALAGCSSTVKDVDFTQSNDTGIQIETGAGTGIEKPMETIEEDITDVLHDGPGTGTIDIISGSQEDNEDDIDTLSAMQNDTFVK